MIMVCTSEVQIFLSSVNVCCAWICDGPTVCFFYQNTLLNVNFRIFPNANAIMAFLCGCGEPTRTDHTSFSIGRRSSRDLLFMAMCKKCGGYTLLELFKIVLVNRLTEILPFI